MDSGLVGPRHLMGNLLVLRSVDGGKTHIWPMKWNYYHTLIGVSSADSHFDRLSSLPPHRILRMHIQVENDGFLPQTREKRRLVRRIGPILVLVLALLSPVLALAKSSGITSASMPNGPANCSDAACHTTASPDVFVTISGPRGLAPGEIAAYTIEMMEFIPGGLLVGTGINLSTDLDGIPEALDPQLEQEFDWPPALQVLDGEITHDSLVNIDPAPTGGVGVFSWTVPVHAPLSSEGIMTISVALNSFDQSFTKGGDHWERAELEVLVQVPEPVLTTQLVSGCALLMLCLVPSRRRKTRARSCV